MSKAEPAVEVLGDGWVELGEPRSPACTPLPSSRAACHFTSFMLSR